MVREDCEIKEIDQIIDEAIMNAKPHYLIKWKNQPHEYDTWEPIENLLHITTQLTTWIKKRRHHQSSSQNVFGNFIPDYPLRQRKRKVIKKRQQIPRHVASNQVIVLDQDCQDIYSEYQKETNNLVQSQQVQNINEKAIQHLSNNKEYPDKLIKKISQKQELPHKSREGMKIVGRVKKEDIQLIDSTFMWKGHRCFKIKLVNGKITNMREDDLKLLCPDMLCDFYQMNGIEF